MNIRTTVGKSKQRIDAIEKARGVVRYLDDFNVPGLLHAKFAKIKSVDTAEAWKVPSHKCYIISFFKFAYLIRTC